MKKVNDLIESVKKSLDGLCSKDETEQLNLSDIPTDLDFDIFSLQGMSGIKYRIFANRLMTFPVNESYLEIGCWMGSTAISALYDNFDIVKKHWIVDNFSEWGNNGITKKTFYESWNRFFPSVSPNLIDADCFAINPKDQGIENVTVYFYDGNHSQESHKKALTHYYDSLSDSFILLIDDWFACKEKNNEIIKGTMDAIEELNLKIHFKEEVSGPMSRIQTNGVGDPYSWWNGCGVFVLEKTQ